MSDNTSLTIGQGMQGHSAPVPVSAPDDIERRLGEMYRKLNLHLEPSIPGPDGISFDFNLGVRVRIPYGSTRRYRVQYWDFESGRLMFSGCLKAGDRLQSKQRFYRNVLLRVSDEDTQKVLLLHKLDLKDRIVVVHLPVETLGDTVGWFHAIELFRQKHQCRLFVAMSEKTRPLFESVYPEITFIRREEMLSIHSYAHYEIGVKFDGSEDILPYDWRLSPLHWVGANVLGIDPHEIDNVPPRLSYDKTTRVIQEPYVCISSMASGGCKLWLNPNGWDVTIAFLKRCGYRVLDIDAQKICGTGIAWQKIPAGAEDWTGTGDGKTLADRASLIHHADFFIGLGSGLSWLAWACHKPVVLISGFSQPFCEFHTPYRVIETGVCHGCFNDPQYAFDASDSFWCPRHKNSDMHLICSRAITPELVIHKIRQIPAFRQHLETQGINIGETLSCEAVANPMSFSINQTIDKEVASETEPCISDVHTFDEVIICNDSEKEPIASITPGHNIVPGDLPVVQLNDLLAQAGGEPIDEKTTSKIQEVAQ